MEVRAPWRVRRRRGELSPPHRGAIHIVTWAVWLTGALWLLFHYFMQVDGTFGPRPHPLEHWWLRGHGLAAMAALVAAGSVLPGHIVRAWRFRRNLLPGLSFALLFASLVATGYALYYLVDEDNGEWISLVHWSVGLALPVLLWTHIVTGRRC